MPALATENERRGLDLCLIGRAGPFLTGLAHACREAGCTVFSPALLAASPTELHVAAARALKVARTIAIAPDEQGGPPPFGALERQLLRDASQSPGRQVVLLTARGRAAATDAWVDAVPITIEPDADPTLLARTLVVFIGLQITLPLYTDLMRPQLDRTARRRPVESVSHRAARTVSAPRGGTARAGTPRRPLRAAR